MYLIVKALLSGVVIAVASEAARRSSLFGAILISLPLTSILALAWLYWDTRDGQQVIDLSWSILWVVVPSLAFFVALPLLMKGGVSFAPALALACVITGAAYAAWVLIARSIGLDL
jgi:uncharacterized membrane protein (GlpM family)